MANETVLLVSEQRMKQWTSLDNNIRIDVLTPSILNAQETYTQDSLGTKFFDRLKAGVKANDLTTDEEAFLRDYVGPALMQYALYMLLPHLKYKFVEKGILNGTSEETQPTSLDELQYLRETTLDTAMFYDKRLREYLIQNPAQFQEWLTWENNGMPRNSDTPYFSGLQTEKSFNINNYFAYATNSPFCMPD
jgi:hypothetical protein|tara:strand:+ start:2949 stop:3524 length:576 start_codon:yes stop_codon:yes gene_type:complete